MRIHFSPKEEKILTLAAEGLTAKQIGNELGTSQYVIKNYLRVIFDKTGMHNRLELALWYLKRQDEDRIQNRKDLK